MKYTCATLTCGLAILAGPILAAPDLSRLPAPAAQQGVTYAKDIRPLFEASCFRCHGSERQKGDLRLDSLEAIMKGGKDGDVVVAGKSDMSDLVIAVAQIDDDTAMPPKKGWAEDAVRAEAPVVEVRVGLEGKHKDKRRRSRRGSRAVAEAEVRVGWAAASEDPVDPEAGVDRHPSL